MRYGFTTGSCSAAAAKAAAYMLLGGRIKKKISIETPKGIAFEAQITDIERGREYVSCSVVKDGGDDPDITSGAHIRATVSLLPDETGSIRIDGGEGVGRVTAPGLDQPVGSAAINSVPRSMIEKEVLEVAELFDRHGGISVVISVPEGREIAEKTFNPRLGIVGGISILGTSGIVEPMSMQAIRDTIRVEIRQQIRLGHIKIATAPGNYGLDFMHKNYDYDLDRAVKCSNFIGDTIDMAAEEGASALLLIGHMGKLVKVSGGIMNTHSKEADCRMELMAAAALRIGASAELCKEILGCLNTTEAYALIREAGIEKSFMEELMMRIDSQLKKRAAGRLETECMVFLNEEGLLGSTAGAEELLKEIRDE